MFNKGDICICKFKLKSYKKAGFGESIEKSDCRVRVIRIESENNSGFCYRVYNMDFERYENLGGIYLNLDKEYIREEKLKELLK